MTTASAAAFVRRHRTGLSVIGLSVVLAPAPLVLRSPWQLGVLNLVAVNAVVVLPSAADALVTSRTLGTPASVENCSEVRTER